MQEDHFVIASLSIIGARETQQDTALVYEREGRLLAAVCDGMGGSEGGELASKTAAGILRELFQKKSAHQSYADFFRTAADMMDEAVFKLKSKCGERLRAGTTIVAVAIEENKMTWLSVGDSRLYITRGTEMIRATREHNYYMQIDELLAQGKLNERQYAAESARGESLLSYLGLGGLEIIDINETPFEIVAGDRLLLASDGLYRAVDDEKIQSIVSEYGARGATIALTSMAKKNFPETLDNTTCVIIHCIGGEKK